MLFEHSDYRKYLRSKLADSISQNSRFSMRAFAKKLGLAPSMMSGVLSGKRNLSLENAYRIARQLGLNQNECEYFSTLVELDATHTPDIRHQLMTRLSRLNTSRPLHDLSVDYYKVICDWYHSPILEMVGNKSFSLKPQAVAKKLDISVIEAQAAIERLERIGLIEMDAAEDWRQSHDAVVARSINPNESLRKFHRQMLDKAIESLTTQTPQEKKIGSETFAFNPEQMQRVDDLMEEFFTKVVQISKESTDGSEIYHLGVQFFRLTQKDKNDETSA